MFGGITRTLIIVTAVLSAIAAHAQIVLDWTELPPLPEPRSGHFAGAVTGGAVVAGGSNFLVSPFQGGEKQWYGDVFYLPPGANEWMVADELPHPRAYGVTVTQGDMLLLIGGTDGEEHFADTVAVGLPRDKVIFFDGPGPLPPLPEPNAYMGGAMLDDTIHIVGGSASLDATSAYASHWTLDLSVNPHEWTEAPSLPGPGRILPVVVAQEGALYVFSGAELLEDDNGQPTRRYLNDGWRYTEKNRWEEVSGPPHPVVAAPAVPFGQSHIFVMSGDDGSLFEQTQELGDDHPGFRKTVLAYHTITDTWTEAGEMPEGVVTTSAFTMNDMIVVPGGEDRPGHRSAQVHAANVESKAGALATLDYVVIGLYFLVLVAMGAYFSRREKSTENFFLGGRNVPWWAVGISLFGTSLSAITYLTIPASAYATNWLLIINQYGVIFFAPVVVAYYIPRFRATAISTAYEYLENRFNVVLRVYGSLNFALFQICRMSIVMLLPAIALSAATGVPLEYSIIAMGILSTIYTVLGGIEAVIWTDVLQTVVLMFGAVLAFFLVVVNVEGGFMDVVATANTAGKLHAVDWSFNFIDTTLWVCLIGSTFSNAYPITADQTMVQRYLTTRTAKEAGRALWVHAGLALPVSFLFFGLGSALWVYFQHHPETLDPNLGSDAVLPLFIVAQFPVGLKGLIIAGIFAATMSSLDSSINSLSSVCVNDYFRRFKGGMTEHADLNLARAFTVLFGIIGTCGALYLSTLETRSLFESFLTMLNLIGGGLAGVFALGVFTRRGNAWGAIAGAVVSAATVIYIWATSDLNPLMYGAVGFLTALVVGYAVSRVTPATPAD